MPQLRVGLAALWWGSLTSLLFWVVPMLFTHLPTPAMAGGMAARLFTTQTWVSSVCGVFLLMTSRSNRPPARVLVGFCATVLIVCGMLLTWVTEFAVAPRIVARENIQLWHRVGSVMYLLQWVCAAATFWKLVSPPKTNQV